MKKLGFYFANNVLFGTYNLILTLDDPGSNMSQKIYTNIEQYGDNLMKNVTFIEISHNSWQAEKLIIKALY